MRNEMLKRLDEFVQWTRELVGPLDSVSQGLWATTWIDLRNEIVAERCENCTHWRFADVGSSALCMKPGAYLYQVSTVYHYCCIHFETKKESTP
jgi:hypothetical protein